MVWVDSLDDVPQEPHGVADLVDNRPKLADEPCMVGDLTTQVLDIRQELVVLVAQALDLFVVRGHREKATPRPSRK